MDVVLLALMEVDRLLMKRGKCAGIVDFPHNARLVGRFDDDEIVGADASQRDRIRRIRIARPMPFATCAMNEMPIAQVLEDLRDVVAAESLVRPEGQLKCRALKMADDDVNIIRID